MNLTDLPFQIKSLDESGTIDGLLAGFGDVDRGGDRLLPGCFTKSLAARSTPLPMLLHHDPHRPIGAWKSWEERPDGLFVAGRMTLAARDAQEAHALARDGALSGLSIGWEPLRGSVDPASGVRTVSEANLFEGSLVAVPMNERARVGSIKSISCPRDIADLLHTAGVSGRRAKAAAGAAWKAIHDQSDESEAEAELAAIIARATAKLRNGG